MQGQRKLIMEQTQENVKRRSWSKRHKRALPIQFEATPMLLNQHEDVATRKTKERSEITKRKPKARRLISESAGSWDSLTYDIQFMILLRLSACYIPRLRLVCKSMRNLLSSDRFIHAHLDYHRFHTMTQIRFLVSTFERVTRHPSIVRTNHHDVAFDLDDNGCATLVHDKILNLLPSHVTDDGSDHPPFADVLSSYNGLILVSDLRRKREIWDKLLVCNPVTGEATLLPSLPRREISFFYGHWMLGYDDLANEYKVAVLKIYGTEGDHHPNAEEFLLSCRRKYQIMIATVGSRSSRTSHHDTLCHDWRVLEVTADFGLYLFPAASNGRMNWLGGRAPGAARPSPCLLSLDLRQEVVQETLYLPLPEVSEMDTVFESHGSLHCMFFGRSGTGKLEIWAMKDWESPNLWTKEITVSLDACYKFSMPNAPVVEARGMTVDANRLILCIKRWILTIKEHQQLFTEECKLVTLDLRSKELKDILCSKSEAHQLRSIQSLAYCVKYFVGSLVKLK